MSNSQGAVINMTGRGFDAFGKPREEGWQDSDHSNGASDPGDLNRNDLSTRGFTGHEHLNETDLIHMNGRVYDYNLGRFLSVDPFIQFPANSQSMNAYSYLMNNPLSGTDPSGYTSTAPDADQSSSGPTGSGSAMDQAKNTLRCVKNCRTDNNSLQGFSLNWGAKSSLAIVQSSNGASTEPTTNMGAGNGMGANGQPANYVELTGAQGSSGNGMMNSAMAEMDATGCQVPLRCGEEQNKEDKVNERSLFNPADPLRGQRGGNVAGYLKNLINYPPELPGELVDFSAGAGDSLLFGFGKDLRWALDIDGGIDYSSTGYVAGEIASFAVGGGRLAYAASAKGASLIGKALTGIRGAQFATSARATIKIIFRAGLFSNYKRYSFVQIWYKYRGNINAIIAAAGKTNSTYNGAAATITAGASFNELRREGE